jgi:hypothetical protein
MQKLTTMEKDNKFVLKCLIKIDLREFCFNFTILSISALIAVATVNKSLLLESLIGG